MNKKIVRLIIGIIAIVGAFALLVHNEVAVAPVGGSLASQSAQPENVPSITLKAGSSTIRLPIKEGISLYDSLVLDQQKGLLAFSGTEYPGLGFFMTDIGTLHQGGGKYLVYFINGNDASIGISSYIPKNGDMIEWQLK